MPFAYSEFEPEEEQQPLSTTEKFPAMVRDVVVIKWWRALFGVTLLGSGAVAVVSGHFVLGGTVAIFGAAQWSSLDYSTAEGRLASAAFALYVIGNLLLIGAPTALSPSSEDRTLLSWGPTALGVVSILVATVLVGVYFYREWQYDPPSYALLDADRE